MNMESTTAPLGIGEHGLPRKGADVENCETFAQASALITTRANVSPKRLVAPGPSNVQLEALLALAAAAPDHGLLTPWRFVLIPQGQRYRLAEVFALALIDRDPGATVEQIEAARAKAYRAPVLLVAIACLGPRANEVPQLERMVSMGAAVQNVLLGAAAMGFTAGLTSGRAMASPRMAALCSAGEGETPVCCINIGTAHKRKGVFRVRPEVSQFLSVLGEQGFTFLNETP